MQDRRPRPLHRILQRTLLGTIAGFFLGLALFLMLGPAHAVDRNTTERYAFDRMTPCPVPTANPHVCPNHQRRHIIPLKCARSPQERDWLDNRFNFAWVRNGDFFAPADCLHQK